MTTTPAIVSSDKKILLSPCLHAWSVPDEELNLEKPLKEYQGCDILTDKTLRQIKDHNDKTEMRGRG